MSNLQITIDLDNAAFDEDPATEASRVLRDISRQVDRGLEEGFAKDINGNTVGTFKIESDPKSYEIVRFYRDGDSEIIKSGLTLEQAKFYCNRPDTKDPNDEWFDGFRAEED